MDLNLGSKKMQNTGEEKKSGGLFSMKSGFILLLFLAVAGSSMIFENLDAKHVMVVQYPWGTLEAFTEPGPKLQLFGKITIYERRSQYAFNKGCKKEDDDAHLPKKVQFNDGGSADLCGAISWEMPKDPNLILALQREFSSQAAVERQLIDKAIDNAVLTSGPTMTSTESAAERRNELLQIVDDQARFGVFQTIRKAAKVKDLSSDQERDGYIVEIVRDDKGLPKRLVGSAVANFGITMQPLSIAEIAYDKIVLAQIAKRQEATTQVQISQANASRAKQDAITAEQQGRANAAKAKWDQETINAKAIAEAEAAVTTAKLSAAAAQLYKQEQILRGEGDAARKKLVMEADGALDKKLEAFVKTQELWSNAFSKYQGQLVPTYSMGGASGQNGMSTVQDFMTLQTVKAMKDLGVDLQAGGRQQTSSKK